ncbi:hypothetical protein ACOMHN_035251 [Nucella lapillus]
MWGSQCCHHVVTMWGQPVLSPCCHHVKSASVVTMLSPCCHHDVTMWGQPVLSPCGAVSVVTMMSPCCHHVVTMLSPLVTGQRGSLQQSGQPLQPARDVTTGSEVFGDSGWPCDDVTAQNAARTDSASPVVVSVAVEPLLPAPVSRTPLHPPAQPAAPQGMCAGEHRHGAASLNTPPAVLRVQPATDHTATGSAPPVSQEDSGQGQWSGTEAVALSSGDMSISLPSSFNLSAVMASALNSSGDLLSSKLVDMISPAFFKDSDSSQL